MKALPLPQGVIIIWCILQIALNFIQNVFGTSSQNHSASSFPSNGDRPRDLGSIEEPTSKIMTVLFASALDWSRNRQHKRIEAQRRRQES
jgi:hypothetical protein